MGGKGGQGKERQGDDTPEQDVYIWQRYGDDLSGADVYAWHRQSKKWMHGTG